MDQCTYFIKVQLYKSQQEDIWQQTAMCIFLHNYLLPHSKQLRSLQQNYIFLTGHMIVSGQDNCFLAII